MARSKSNSLTVACPCCSARLTIDARLGKVLSHDPPPKRAAAALNLDRAGALLREQAERREALFRQSSENEKVKAQVLESKFEAALEKSKDEPLEKPTRDIDLD